MTILIPVQEIANLQCMFNIPINSGSFYLTSAEEEIWEKMAMTCLRNEDFLASSKDLNFIAMLLDHAP